MECSEIPKIFLLKISNFFEFDFSEIAPIHTSHENVNDFTMKLNIRIIFGGLLIKQLGPEVAKSLKGGNVIYKSPACI